ncbi:hypothetical protein Pyn_00085 [Prunus yedoensis var. nudiflora]|uniref:Uncharacterized protein n=1 Tax=Prunus yedoensis var. nudiflora TaxID=2094558 RepID=A0A314UK82_PRUYE|nr:hypothetical protein Pyn_00085 [Prunus yedoensis var. nudiflora]
MEAFSCWLGSRSNQQTDWSFQRKSRYDVVPFKFGEKSSQTLSSTGYQNMAFKAYNGNGLISIT